MRKTLLAGLPALNIELSPAQADTLCAFGEALLEKNKVMNLTAIREPERVATLHLLDSLALLRAAELPGRTLVDVGCGAGFPGVPLKIACPEIKLTLLDSLGKRMDWLRTVLPSLAVDAEVVTARAEEYAADHREQFDICTSRAVARLSVLSELCLPLVKVGGKFLAMKGAAAEEELKEAEKGIRLLGGQVAGSFDYPIEDAVHHVLVIEKVSPTPTIRSLHRGCPAVAVIRNRARSLWPIRAYCFWMNCRSFGGRHWKCFDSLWRMGK